MQPDFLAMQRLKNAYCLLLILLLVIFNQMQLSAGTQEVPCPTHPNTQHEQQINECCIYASAACFFTGNEQPTSSIQSSVYNSFNQNVSFREILIKSHLQRRISVFRTILDLYFGRRLTQGYYTVAQGRLRC